jgi:hypothetical protein
MCYFTHSVRRGFVTIWKRAARIYLQHFSVEQKTKNADPRLNKNWDGKINLGDIK